MPLWITSILIDFLIFVGIVSNLDNVFLAVTVLSVVNSLTDLLSLISLSNKGYSTMGITGVYAG